MWNSWLRGPLVSHFYTLVPPIMYSEVVTLDFVYCTVTYSDSEYFLGHALVDVYSLHSCTVICSNKRYGMRLIYMVG